MEQIKKLFERAIDDFLLHNPEALDSDNLKNLKFKEPKTYLQKLEAVNAYEQISLYNFEDFVGGVDATVDKDMLSQKLFTLNVDIKAGGFYETVKRFLSYKEPKSGERKKDLRAQAMQKAIIELAEQLKTKSYENLLEEHKNGNKANYHSLGLDGSKRDLLIDFKNVIEGYAKSI